VTDRQAKSLGLYAAMRMEFHRRKQKEFADRHIAVELLHDILGVHLRRKNAPR
jgi:hypothetical protein